MACENSLVTMNNVVRVDSAEVNYYHVLFAYLAVMADWSGRRHSVS